MRYLSQLRYHIDTALKWGEDGSVNALAEHTLVQVRIFVSGFWNKSPPLSQRQGMSSSSANRGGTALRCGPLHGTPPLVSCTRWARGFFEGSVLGFI